MNLAGIITARRVGFVSYDKWTLGLIAAGFISESSRWWAATGIYECHLQ